MYSAGRAVPTPQVVYSGRLHGPGSSIKQIEEKFAVRDVSPYPASIAFEKDGVTVSGILPEKVDKAGVILVKFRPGQTKVTPGAGANKGRRRPGTNTVRTDRRVERRLAEIRGQVQ